MAVIHQDTSAPARQAYLMAHEAGRVFDGDAQAPTGHRRGEQEEQDITRNQVTFGRCGLARYGGLRWAIAASLAATLLLAVICGLAVAAKPAGAQPSAAEAAPPKAPPPPPPPPTSTVTVDLTQPPAEPARVVLCLGGGRLAATISGQAGDRPAWELRSDKLVIARGQPKPDERGVAQVQASLPDVRVRAEAVLAVVRGGQVWTHRVDILPAAMLGDVRETLARAGLGVTDSRGLVQNALKAQDVAVTDLWPQLQNDFFRGEIAILAGFDDANTLAAACDRLAGRVRQGMALVVLNPPRGFQSLGLRRVELPPPPAATPAAPAAAMRVRLATELASTLKDSDLAACSPGAHLAPQGQADPAIVLLAWMETPAGRADANADANAAPAGQPAKPAAARLALIAARPAGQGVVVAACLPQLEDCHRDPAGRCLLSEIIKWILKRSRKSKENQT